MAKKNPYVFTIGFDEANPSHVRAAEILNGTRKKASLIAAAVVSHVDGTDSERVSEFHPEAIQSILEKLVKKELEKAMNNQGLFGMKNKEEPEQSVSLSSDEEEQPLDECMTQDIMSAMDVFRKN